MNTPGADILTRAELDRFAGDIEALVADGEAGSVTVAFTMVSTSGDDVDLATGAVTAAEGVRYVNAARITAIEDVNAGVQVGDVMLLMDGRELAREVITPRAADRITVDGIEVEIVNAERDPTGTVWRIQGRAVEGQA